MMKRDKAPSGACQKLKRSLPTRRFVHGDDEKGQSTKRSMSKAEEEPPARSDDEHLCLAAGCGGHCETEALLTPIELHVVLAHEDIPENPERAARRGHVHTHETEDALTAGLLQDQVLLL